MKKIFFLIIISFNTFTFSYEEVPLKEKISQLIMVSANINEIDKIRNLLKENIGGIQIQYGVFSFKETQKFTSLIYDSTFTICPFLALDYEGGSVYSPETLGLMNLPTNMMLGAANDINNTASLFYLAGLELKKAGINMSFSPVMDVNTNPLNPIIGIRSFSSNPEIVYNLGKAVINGLKATNIISVLKHFPGHGDTFLDSHKALPEVNLTEQELINIHIYPFKKLIDEKNADFIMMSHVLYPVFDKKYPASLSKKIMVDYLRKELKYENLIITDSLDMKAITSNYSIEEAAYLAFKNGANFLLIGSGNFYKTRDKIISETLKGNIDINHINNSYKKILEIKKKYNLNKNKIRDEFTMAYDSITNELSSKAITIIRNKDNLIPFSEQKDISLIFFMPERFYPETINLYKSLLNYGFNVKQFNFNMNPNNNEINKIEEILKKSDLVVIGSFQWSNIQNINQKKIIKKILKEKEKTIFISLMSPYDIKNYPEAKNIIATYGITSFTMQSLADVLSGELKAKGNLPIKLNFN